MASLLRSARLVRALVVVATLVPLVQACGGRSDTEDYLFGADGTITTGASTGTAGRGSTGGGTRSGGGTSSTAGRNGTAGTGATSFGGAVTMGGSGTIPQGGVTTTGGSGTVGGAISAGGVGTAGMGAAGGSVSVTPIVCGAEACDAATQSCCAGLSGLSCIGKNRACDGAVLGCTVNADCAGKGVCCISVTGDVSAASSCKMRCDGGSTRDRQLCQTDDECVAPTRYCTQTIFGVKVCTRRP
jgi:hypothetical protein